jgi:protein ImuB
LAGLPVSALRLPAAVLERLKTLDLLRIGQVQTLPRSTLPARFGPALLQRLDQAEGRRAEGVTPCRPAAPPCVRREWDEPLASRCQLQAVLDELLVALLTPLQERRQGVLQLQLLVQQTCWSLSLVQATATVGHLRELIRLQAERQEFPEQVTSAALTAVVIAPLGFRQLDLFGAHQPADAAVMALLDRLGNRLGPAAILQAEWQADHQPEEAVRFTPLTAARRPLPPARTDGDAGTGWPVASADRPLWLLTPPEAIAVACDPATQQPCHVRWHDRAHEVHQSWGPERIETGWWRDPSVRRDYYRVETHEGAQFWLFQQRPQGVWFLHGVFG